jgi:two-component system response regulator BaeR
MDKPVVIVEDEVKIAELLQDYCADAGYKTQVFHNGDEALAWLLKNTARLVLLDLMLPGTDGLSICQEYRKISDVPVIIITARVEEIDRLLGLGLGADDYICKPFSPREVIARMKSILRRVEKSGQSTSDLKLDASSFRIYFKDASTDLTAVEFNLLKAMFDAPGRIFSRETLMSQIYSDYRVVSDRTIDSHIKKLRKKLNEINLVDQAIHSVYGAGYKFE